ncbi:ATP-binding cassette domain-containing protein [Thermus scotoductus]|uniref:ABC transporter ATP-binding protein n=1 Tax=Thermus scotoductus TaxID=37636 RepID=A0A430RAK5_THESC|nr:ATP-binding cassette domain-containing protein [Thermus scotoductus]RTG97334.1 ABC transporter ATP-binding protein [Thermus scotoductus]RTH04404.1 ABC transporter ATP-binding protein [Thermus scotoductus]RTH19171.1 ABC transporter ATP-binding protein [Thermus scotoductus]RTH99177.1 ABC transporter ATP-binding protein [Thermus scotoductus]RTI20703.1 ABC transporter ATP-binding protein [Thermus scotoductus]
MSPVLQAQGLVHRYGGFSLEVPHLEVYAGEILAVLGPSGSGKTTLLRLLAGLLSPEEGQVEGGFRAYLPQTPPLLQRSVLENAAFGLWLRGVPRHQARARAFRLLEEVGLEGKARQPAHLLSGGEVVRLALARTLLVGPAVLLLDEPTASLDPANTLKVEALLQEAARGGRGVVLATHDLFQVRRLAHRVVFLFQGQVVEEAPADRFFQSPRDSRSQAFLEGRLLP